jgi:hypothetical protein
MPKLAHSKLESCWGDISREANSLAVERFAKASIRGIPPDCCGTGKSMFWAKSAPATKRAGSRQSVRFI